ncbi:MAG: hypothetical protein JJV96_02730 [Alphaproteobacteria bacterium]|nr:hypothetical protein [Alphaproteobacteria bacterium]
MNATTEFNELEYKKFNSAENLWFWYCKSSSISKTISVNKNLGEPRVCTVQDVSNCVATIYLANLISKKHLQVLKFYGDKQVPPDRRVDPDDSLLWTKSLLQLKIIFKSRKFIGDDDAEDSEFC